MKKEKYLDQTFIFPLKLGIKIDKMDIYIIEVR
jgi:hypothetical protein